MDKQLREAIENILTDDDVEYQYILDEGFGKDKATTAFRDLRVRTTDDLLALFHTYGNRERKINGDTSDGYHTFNELYNFRMLYNALLFNEWARNNEHKVHKSKKHSDNEPCFGGEYFVVVASLPTGQITNHYKLKYWEVFDIPEQDKADKWDGHTPQDVADRLRSYLTPPVGELNREVEL
jgi:hypothetical protein